MPVTGLQSVISAIRADMAKAKGAIEGIDVAAEAVAALDKALETLDGAVVHKAGDESIGGVKTFANSPVLSAEGANRLAAFSPDKKLTGLDNAPRPGQVLLSSGPGALPQWGDVYTEETQVYTASANIPAVGQNAKNVMVTLAKGSGDLLLNAHIEWTGGSGNWYIPFMMAEIQDSAVVFHLDGHPGGNCVANVFKIVATFVSVNGDNYTTVETNLPAISANAVHETLLTQTVPTGRTFLGFYLASNGVTNWWIPYMVADTRTAGKVSYKAIGHAGGSLAANALKVVSVFR